MTIRREAPARTRFAATAFDGQLGKVIPVQVPPNRTAGGILRAAFVPDDGSYADLTLELPDGTLPPAVLAQLSIGR